VAVSHPDPEAYATLAVGAESWPPPEFETATLWGAGSAPPWVAPNESVVVERASAGDADPGGDSEPEVDPELHAVSDASNASANAAMRGGACMGIPLVRGRVRAGFHDRRRGAM
jgi:hypothetical protein